MGRMILSICGVVVAVGLAGAASAPSAPGGLPPSQSLERVAAGKQNDAKRTDGSPPIDVRLVQAPEDEARTRAQEKQAQQHEAADLVAQQKAADAATASANWTGQSVFWAAIGSVATGLAAILAFAAWYNSAKALRVAIQGQRAHLLLEDTLGGNCFGSPPWDRPPVFCYKIANHGQSPAWITGFEIKPIVGDIPADPPDVVFSQIRTIVLAPNATTDHFTDEMDLPDGFTWSDDICVYVAIRYRDIYADRRATCLFKLHLHGGPKNQDIMVPWGSGKWWTYE